MKRVLAVLALVALVAGPWVAVQAGEKDAAAKAALDQKVGDFTLKDIYGKSWSLADTMAETKAKAVILEVLSSKCPVSVGYDDLSTKNYAEMAEKDVLYLGICPSHNGHETARDLRVWAAKAKVAFPVLLDQDQKVSDMLGAGVTPTYYVLDAEGKLRYHGALDNKKKPGEEGYVDYVKAAVDAILANKEVEKKNFAAFGCTVKRA